MIQPDRSTLRGTSETPMWTQLTARSTLALVGTGLERTQHRMYGHVHSANRERSSTCTSAVFRSHIVSMLTMSRTGSPGPEFVMPWLLLPAAVLYIIYLGFAATAYHHVRKERRLNAPSYNMNYQHEMYPEDRLSYTPGVYAPGLYTASSDRAESMPVRSDVGSPVAPPKYMTRREVPLPSRVSSSRYTESLQSKRDSKGAACTCVNCPSHH